MAMQTSEVRVYLKLGENHNTLLLNVVKVQVVVIGHPVGVLVLGGDVVGNRLGQLG